MTIMSTTLHRGFVVLNVVLMTVWPNMAIQFNTVPGVCRSKPEPGEDCYMRWTTNYGLGDNDYVEFFNPAGGSIIALTIGVRVEYGAGYDASKVEYNVYGGEQEFVLLYPTSCCAPVEEVHDTGNYTCLVRYNNESAIVNSHAVLYEYDQPTRPQINVPDALVSSTATFTCTSQPTSQPTEYPKDPPLLYYWYLNDTDITNDLPDRHNTTDNQLVISDVEVSDGLAAYRCVARESAGYYSNSSDSVSINVIESLANRIDAVAENINSFIIPCAVSAQHELATITWSFNGGDLPTVVMTSHSESSEGKRTLVTETLTWSDTSSLEERRQTGGTYTCTGTVEGDILTTTDFQVVVQ